MRKLFEVYRVFLETVSAVQVVLRAVVDWKRGDVEETSKGMTWPT